jgi:hypothetical protein
MAVVEIELRRVKNDCPVISKAEARY